MNLSPNCPLKKPPGEDTGPTIHADFLGNLVGRVPSRGERDVLQQAANHAPANGGGPSPLQSLRPVRRVAR